MASWRSVKRAAIHTKEAPRGCRVLRRSPRGPLHSRPAIAFIPPVTISQKSNANHCRRICKRPTLLHERDGRLKSGDGGTHPHFGMGRFHATFCSKLDTAERVTGTAQLLPRSRGGSKIGSWSQSTVHECTSESYWPSLRLDQFMGHLRAAHCGEGRTHAEFRWHAPACLRPQQRAPLAQKSF